nr:MAG TPA: hypothetical protein [Bacteriophage sp.]
MRRTSPFSVLKLYRGCGRAVSTPPVNSECTFIDTPFLL